MLHGSEPVLLLYRTPNTCVFAADTWELWFNAVEPMHANNGSTVRLVYSMQSLSRTATSL